MSRTLALLAAIVSAAAVSVTTAAPLPIPAPPAVEARSYILIDHATGRVLAQSGADDRVEPASITKVMTSYVAFDAIRQKRASMDSDVPVSEKAWRQGIDSSESRMFLDVGQKVKLGDLLRGIIVQSGNDAAVAVAEFLGGTEDAFAEMMNHYAQKLGMKSSRFHDASGMPDPEHYSTARDIATLSSALIRDFPEQYKIYAERQFTWNKDRSGKPIVQYNRNGLLARDSSVDGIKTGHTETAGYCLASSASRNGMRLIAVVMGTKSIKAREDASAALLNYGFTFFETTRLKGAADAIAQARVYKGETENVGVGTGSDLYVTVARGEASRLKTDVRLDSPLIAPLAAGAKVGEMTVTDSTGQVVAKVGLETLEAVPEGGIWTRLVDSVSLWLE
jgi:D-alanyl-D-alanine carboxypeptidase (penicillin-binding protein 5/6)